ncbi:Leucine-rich repeat-containing protein [Cynara cardunculus var. scolymus]|uniref:Leucine-rich repeat-containing protein n=1 Tax=Cynara cardunculus var. scolymus TaxID=59895 RepID=A0A103WNS8_CYNCS|nr:Leucine-rich repeat-containing protein [Cynara cardunculus var. scolymus]
MAFDYFIYVLVHVTELAQLTNLEELDLSHTYLSGTPSIQECTRLSRLKKLKSISLPYNNFNKSIFSCLSALPSLKTLDLSSGFLSRGSFPIKGIDIVIQKKGT